MAIFRTQTWVPPVATTFPTVQDYRENPDGPYRELLMAADVNGIPVPFLFDVVLPAGGRTYIRIPHALSIGSTGAAGQAASAVNGRIPDVVIPIPIVPVDDTIAPAAVVIPAWNTDAAHLTPGSTTGMFADEDYIYLCVIGAGRAAAHVYFVVYVEYTHSVITNEIVTTTYAVEAIV
jgi:hypothetical protein